jgi:hypothetical protein
MKLIFHPSPVVGEDDVTNEADMVGILTITSPVEALRK